MSDPGAGSPVDEEPYAGPPPTLRPGPGAWQQPAWVLPPVFPGPPAGIRWAPPPGTPPHDVPQPYLLAMRSRDWGWWRPLLGLLLLGVVYVVAATVVVFLSLATGVGTDFAQLDLVDPPTLLLTNLSLIVAIPVVWLAWVVAHGMSRSWSSSVLARLRWRLVLPYTLMALGTLGAGIALSVLAAFLLGDEEVTGPVASIGWLLAVVLLTTPLQSAAEEYLFRGYLSQAIAGWVRRPLAGAVVAAVVTAALFSAAHLPPDVPTFVDRFAFGLAASAVVWLTGGLEAAIVLHAVNNVGIDIIVNTLGGFEESMVGAETRGTPLSFAVSALVSLLALALVLWQARRTGVDNWFRPQVPIEPPVGEFIPGRSVG
jgi:membrane protease YdiL (CAAX protease family)